MLKNRPVLRLLITSPAVHGEADRVAWQQCADVSVFAAERRQKVGEDGRAAERARLKAQAAQQKLEKDALAVLQELRKTCVHPQLSQYWRTGLNLASVRSSPTACRP